MTQTGLDTPSAQRQFLVRVIGFEEWFMTKSGGNITSDTVKVYNGGQLKPDVLAGPADIDNISVTRVFYRKRDDIVLKNIRAQVGSFRTTITVTPTDEQLIPDGEQVIYPDVLLVGFTEMEVDAASGDAATYQMDFACPEVQ